MIRRFWDQEFKVINLSDMGYDDIVFELDVAIEFMRCAVKHNVRILGGDIIFKQGEEYVIGPDSWYSNNIDPSESLNDALRYLQMYKKNNGTREWVVSVVTDNILDLVNKCK